MTDGRMIAKLPDGQREKIARFQATMPVDIVGLCEEMGAKVEVRDDMPRILSGYILKTEGGKKCNIYCNGNDPKSRQRFTLAHELAHYLLHWDDLSDRYPENFMLRGGLSNKKETEANKLAAEILMPYTEIDSYVDPRHSVPLVELAGYFGVSRQAMAIRLGVPLDTD